MPASDWILIAVLVATVIVGRIVSRRDMRRWVEGLRADDAVHAQTRREMLEEVRRIRTLLEERKGG